MAISYQYVARCLIGMLICGISLNQSSIILFSVVFGLGVLSGVNLLFPHSVVLNEEQVDQPLEYNPPPLIVSQIRTAIDGFMKRCDIHPQMNLSYADLITKCTAEATVRGYLGCQDGVLDRFIPIGACIARLGYAHQPEKVQVYICFHTAFLTWMDDAFKDDVYAVQQFNHRFITRQPQALELLDHLAELLLELPAIWGTVIANIMTVSTLNLITALSIEKEVNCLKLEPSAYRFPAFSRAMSGNAEAYATFAFPSEVPYFNYIQAMPDMVDFINHTNDIMSCYKEQLAGETENQIYLSAKCRGVAQTVVLQELVDGTVAAHKRVIGTLQPCRSALDAYLSFTQGYMGFYLDFKRYKLHELDLEREFESTK